MDFLTQTMIPDESRIRRAYERAAVLAQSSNRTPPARTDYDRYAAEWQANAALRSEFVTWEDYAGFRRAEETGTVKFIRQVCR